MKTNPRSLLILLSFAALVATPLAHADADKREAAIEKLRAKFDAADSNHDGYLSRDEAEKGMPYIAAHFDDVDTDHDGKLSQAEVAAYLVKARAGRGK